MFSVLVIRLRSLRLLRVSGIVMRLRMFLLLITFLKSFFSSRSRHTRSLCDWSSDVCSSDLILRNCKKTICVEANYSGQFARHLRAETGITVDHHILKYDCEPFEPHQILEEVKAILEGRERSRDVTMEEAREMAYHYIRSRLTDTLRPGRIIQRDGNGFDEAVWDVEILSRESGDKRGALLIGIETGSTYSWQPVV